MDLPELPDELEIAHAALLALLRDSAEFHITLRRADIRPTPRHEQLSLIASRLAKRLDRLTRLVQGKLRTLSAAAHFPYGPVKWHSETASCYVALVEKLGIKQIAVIESVARPVGEPTESGRDLEFEIDPNGIERLQKAFNEIPAFAVAGTSEQQIAEIQRRFKNLEERTDQELSAVRRPDKAQPQAEIGAERDIELTVESQLAQPVEPQLAIPKEPQLPILVEPQPAIPTDQRTGFLGGLQIAEALSIHLSQRNAFFRQLERKRRELGDGNWHEVREPRPNSPRFLYRVDSREIRELAAKYTRPKLG